MTERSADIGARLGGVHQLGAAVNAMRGIAAAHNEIERQLSELQGQQRAVRREEITAEIIEPGAAEAAGRMNGR